MLAVSQLTNDKNERETEMEVFSAEFNDVFSNSNIFDAIDLDDLFTGINGGDLLPDLEMYPELTVSGLCEDSEANFTSPPFDNKLEEKEKDTASGSASDLGSGSSSLIQAEEIVSKNKGPSNGKGKKSSKNRHGKKKLKVDWTPELHKRFVEAVEQLGVDKAVPSRILEIMGTHCLTRHNIASHLQKYRSQQKHRLARKAEVVSQSQGWQLYGAASLGKRNVMNPWIAAPTMGFPPLTPSMTHFRPLHVWGHPPSSQSLAHTWPKHVASLHGAPNITPWSSAHHPSHTLRPPPVHPSFWHAHNNRFSSNTHVPRVPTPQEMYKAETKFGANLLLSGQSLSQPPSHVHPSKESVDAAIGDVLSKPWMPLPLGLKPPSTDSVMVELQRQGISNVPPTRAQ